MICRILILQMIVFLSFAGTGLGNTPYHDIYGKGMEKIGMSTSTITVLYFDVADDDTTLTEVASARMRLKHLAVGFERWKEVCTIIVVTPSTSLLSDRIRHLLATNQDICVNKSDELWAKYHRGPIPAAMVDFDPKWYVPFVSSSDDPEGVRAFQHLFLPKKNSKMTEMLKAAITRRVTEAKFEGDSHFESGKADEARASYSVARSWLDHLSNPVEGFDPRELASGYLELGNNYIRIAESGKTQSNPQTVAIDEGYLESQYLEEAARCLERARRYTSDEVVKMFHAGLTYENQGKLEEARNSYQEALSQKRDWIEVKISLTRVEEKVRQVLLCIEQEVLFYDGLPQREGEFLPNQFEQMLCEELINRKYKVWIISSAQKKEMHELLKKCHEDHPRTATQRNEIPMVGRTIYGKVRITIRRFRPRDFDLLVAEGSFQINAARLGNTGVLETFASAAWEGKDDGNGETDSKAMTDFFEKNKGHFEEEIGCFLGKLGKSEEHLIKRTRH